MILKNIQKYRDPELQDSFERNRLGGFKFPNIKIYYKLFGVGINEAFGILVMFHNLFLGVIQDMIHFVVHLAIPLKICLLCCVCIIFE